MPHAVLTELCANQWSPLVFAGRPCETAHLNQLVDSPNAAYLLMILLQLQLATTNFDVHSQSIAQYVNEEISNIHLAV